MSRIPCCVTAVVLLLLLATVPSFPADPGPSVTPAENAAANALSGGELRVAGGQGGVQRFPLKHTEVHAEITGNVAQVRVNQIFQNPYERPIEAVYVFPLPRKAAVDDMEIRIGDRAIRGVVKRREEARAIYDAARRSGRTAALLDQERPNIFTQSVANILPGEEIVVSIRFFDVVSCDSGIYEFVFPMVVGPRYIPGDPVRAGERGWSPDTTGVPDASRITPPVLRPEERSGHDISLEVEILAGARLHGLASPSHSVDVERPAPGSARVRLREGDTIPNKDFVLRYRFDGDTPEIVVLPHRAEGSGYFLTLIQPEAQPPRERVGPKEMIFVVDCSGSMSGFPIEKVKEAMRYALENLNPLDNFQIIRFSNEVEAFAPGPVPATPSHIARALNYVEGLSGDGGTILLEGVKAALSYPEDPQRLRIISFMTDGYIGNEEEILTHLRENLGSARLFSFGVGSSPNRYLLDKMAEFGRGAVQYILLNARAADSVQDFYEKIRSPYLTDIELDWGDLRVSRIYPARIPDLFLGQPLVLFGRYEGPGTGELTLSGRLGGRPYARRLRVELPERREGGEAIASLWARSKIDSLSHQAAGDLKEIIVEVITDVALEHRLVTAYTSFVAVEEWPRTAPEEPAQCEIPVPMPEGVSHEGVFGPPFPGGLGETVLAEGKAELVNTESAMLSTIISSEYISGMPVLGRDYQDVLTLAPGVTDVSGPGRANIHGARDTDVVTLVDGASTADLFTREYGQVLDTDSIHQIEVITANASAEYSRAPGGFTGIVVGSRYPAIRQAGALPAFCQIRTAQESYRVGEKIELYLLIENLSRKTVMVPVSLSVREGTAIFRILDGEWNLLPDPPPGNALQIKQRRLRPGKWIVYRITLNAEGGYSLAQPGLYHLVFLGSTLGLPDSTQLTLRIEP